MTPNRPQSLIELRPSRQPRLALADHAYITLKHHILRGELRPGQRLIEKDLCAELGISRTPLREALNRLGLEGLVSLVPYCGYEVVPITLQDIRDMSELRYVVESESAALAAERATPEEIAQLEEVAELKYTPGDRDTYENYLQSNSAFHVLLAHCSHNLRLEATVVSLLDQLQRPLYLGLDVGLDPEEATAEHLAIVQAVRDRDGRRAARLMREQIRDAEKRIAAAFEAIGADYFQR